MNPQGTMGTVSGKLTKTEKQVVKQAAEIAAVTAAAATTAAVQQTLGAERQAQEAAEAKRAAGGSRLNQSSGRRPDEAVEATASRRLDEPVAEGVEDSGEVAADFGDRFFGHLGEGAVECLMDFRLQSGAAFQAGVDQDPRPQFRVLGVGQIRPTRGLAAQAGVPPVPDRAGDREVVILGSHSRSLHHETSHGLDQLGPYFCFRPAFVRGQ